MGVPIPDSRLTTPKLPLLRVNDNQGGETLRSLHPIEFLDMDQHPKYPQQYECIEKLVRACGQDKLAEAYFLGNISALERAVDATKGHRTFWKWKDLMEKKKFDAANKLLSR